MFITFLQARRFLQATAKNNKKEVIKMGHMLIKAALIVGLNIACFSTAAFGDTITLTLLPSGSVSSPAGSVVGWGYTLDNGTADWIEAEDLNADSFQEGTPQNLFDFPSVAPFSAVSVAFSLSASTSCSSPPCGLYDLAWDTSASVGFVNSGTFIISSEFFDSDPSGSSAVDLGPAPDALAEYSASVMAATTSVPEPSPMFLLFGCLVTLVALSLRQKLYSAIASVRR